MIDTIIIIYDQAYVSGGAAKIAIGQAIALKNKGYRVIYFSAIGPVDDKLKKSGVEIHCIGGEHIAKTNNPFMLCKGIWNCRAKTMLSQLLQVLDSSKTVVHIHGWTKALSSSIFSACADYKYKTFITLHEYFTICPNGGLYNYRTDCICNKRPNSINCFVCNCDKRNYIQKIYRNVRHLVMYRNLHQLKPHLIYISKFSRDVLEKAISFSKKSFFIENHVEILQTERISVETNSDYLFIGRMSREKGAELFCEAVTKAGVHGVVIGDGPQLIMLKKMYPNVTFTGWKSSDEMEIYLKKARCLIIASKWYETMGLTILEMQAKGIPCIVPNRCAGTEYIEDNKTGIIYKTGDIQSLINSIKLTKDDDYIAEMSFAFFNTIDSERFSMERHIKNLINIYNS